MTAPDERLGPPGAAVRPDPLGSADDRRWTIDLPADPAAARAVLAAAERRAAALDAALDAVPARLEAALALAERPAPVAFDLAPTPEQTLAAALRAIRRPVAFDPDAGPDADPDAKGPLRRAVDQITARLDGLLDVARHAARVETRIAGRLVATSTLGWLGDARTLVRADADPATLAAHEQTVGLVARTRRGRLRFAVVVITGTARVAAAFAGGALAALPALYRFVDQVVAEYDAMQAAAAAAPGGNTR